MHWQSGGKGTAAAPSLWSSLLVLVVGALTAAAVGWAIVYGPALHARAEQLKAEQIDQENRALCARLAMSHGSDRFEACAGALDEARRRHGERLAIEAAGIL
jgi:hypothetical protein